MNTKRIATILFLAICCASAFALAPDYISIDAGMLLIGNSDPQSAPSPIVPSIGVSMPLVFEGTGFFLLPRLSFTGTDYMISPSSKRPAPAEIENAEQFVFMTFLDVLAGYRFPVSDSIDMGFLAGLSFLFRIPIAYDPATTDSGQYFAYFYGNARFLYPDTEVYAKWNFTGNLGLTLTLKVLWPVFHLWDNENLSLFDQLVVSGAVGFCIKL
jgi:hypothetical protein